MNAQQISWLPEEVRNHIAQLERDLARMEEYLRNSGRNMDEAQEQIAGRDSKIGTLSADLARATAERDAAKAEALGNAASYRDADARRAENYRMLTTVQGERDVAKRDIVALRASVAELEKEAMILRGTVEAVTTQRQQVEQCNAELVAALEKIAKSDHLANGRYAAHNAAQALARAESATPDHIPDAAKMVSATPAKHCEDCAPEFGCWDGGESCYKQPLQSSTPAKHPDTEIVDLLDAQFQGGDDWCRLFPLGNTIREAYAARKQEVSRE